MRWWVKLAFSQKRLHVSRRPIGALESYPNQGPDHKPRGLWYACGTEWIDFVNREYKYGKGDYLYEITLNPSRMLFIDDPLDFMKFEKAYGVFYGRDKIIDWSKVAERYGGIEICPYRYEMRMRSTWYYPWDVASGCIWDPSAVSDIKEVKSSSIDERPVDREED